MHIVLGATGHVGSALARDLLSRGEPVTVVTRDPKKQLAWEQRGARVAVVDVCDTAALHRVLATGKRAFVLNPPAPVSTDTVAEERKTLASIVKALEGVRLDKVVAESTYGARPGEGRGDLNVLHDLEQALSHMPNPSSVIRAAYYMSNWDAALQDARDHGQLHTLYPAELELPMVAPDDLGSFAAQLMCGSAESSGPHYVEGPARYSSQDVANAFAAALGSPVEVVVTPRAQWESTLRQAGYSAEAARSMARMTETTLERDYEVPDQPERGKTTLQDYIDRVVQRP